MERSLKLHAKAEALEADKGTLTQQLQRSSARMAQEDLRNEELAQQLADTRVQFQTLADEHQHLQMAYTVAEGKLRDKTTELDALLARWMEEKQQRVDALNAALEEDEESRRSQVHAQLVAAASTKDVGALDEAGGGWCRALLPAEVTQTVTAHADDVVVCAHNQQGTHLATAGVDKLVKLWDAAGQPVATLRGHTAAITCMGFNGDGTMLAAGAADSTIHLFRVDTLRSKHTMKGHRDKVNTVAFGHDGKSLFSGGQDHTLKSWDCSRGFFKTNAMVESNCTALATFLGDNVLSAHFDLTLQTRDGRADIKTITNSWLSGHAAAITSVCFHPDGRRLITASRDHTIREFDVRMMEQVALYEHDEYRTAPPWGTRPCYSSDGAYVAAGGASGTLFVWNTATASLEKHIKKNGHDGAITCTSWRSDGAEVVTVGRDKTFRVWS